MREARWYHYVIGFAAGLALFVPTTILAIAEGLS